MTPYVIATYNHAAKSAKFFYIMGYDSFVRVKTCVQGLRK